MYGHVLSFSLGKGKGVRWLGHMVGVCFTLKKKIIYLLIWLCWVLVAAHRIFVAARVIFVGVCGIFSCGMHVGYSSLTRDRTQAPCFGRVES